jgi:hypothetical protein
MPKWLVLSAVIAVIVLIVVMSLLNRASLQPTEEAASNAPAAAAPAPVATALPQQRPAPATAAQGPVVIAATAPAWVRVSDQGKTLYEATMQPGQTYQVPQTAVAPTLRAGAPEALRITVGTAVAPPVGPAGQVTSNVSLKGPDLMHAGAQPAAPARQ